MHFWRTAFLKHYAFISYPSCCPLKYGTLFSVICKAVLLPFHVVAIYALLGVIYSSSVKISKTFSSLGSCIQSPIEVNSCMRLAVCIYAYLCMSVQPISPNVPLPHLGNMPYAHVWVNKYGYVQLYACIGSFKQRLRLLGHRKSNGDFTQKDMSACKSPCVLGLSGVVLWAYFD